MTSLTVPRAGHSSQLARSPAHARAELARAGPRDAPGARGAFPWLSRPAPLALTPRCPSAGAEERQENKCACVCACVEGGVRICPWGCPWRGGGLPWLGWGLLAQGKARNTASLHQNTGQTLRTPSRTNFREVCPLVLMQPSGRKLAISAWIFWRVAHGFAFYTNDIALFQYCFPFPLPDFRLLKADCSCRGPLLLLEDKSKGLPY